MSDIELITSLDPSLVPGKRINVDEVIRLGLPDQDGQEGKVLSTGNSGLEWIESGAGVVSNEYQVKWESDWFDIAASGTYDFDLTGQEILDIPVEQREVRLVAKVKSDTGNWLAGDILTLDTTNLNGSQTGEVGSVSVFRENNLRLSFGSLAELLWNTYNGGTASLLKTAVQIMIVVTGTKVISKTIGRLVSKWFPNTEYLDQMLVTVIMEDKEYLYECIETHTSGEAFDPLKFRFVGHQPSNPGTSRIKVDYILEAGETEIPLGVTLNSIEDIDRVNTDNHVLLASNYTLNEDKNVLILNDYFEDNTNVEIVLFNTPERFIYKTDFPLFGELNLSHVLTGDNKFGWADEGELITSENVTAIEAIDKIWTNGTEEATKTPFPYKYTDDGIKVVDIQYKDQVDAQFETYGKGDYWIYDQTNSQVYAPRKKKRELVKSWKNGAQWYNLYSDGWCEQGGRSTTLAVDFNINFASTEEICINRTYLSAASNTANISDVNIATLTVSGFTIANTRSVPSMWRALGYADLSTIDIPISKTYYRIGDTLVKPKMIDYKKQLDLHSVALEERLRNANLVPIAQRLYSPYPTFHLSYTVGEVPCNFFVGAATENMKYEFNLYTTSGGTAGLPWKTFEDQQADLDLNANVGTAWWGYDEVTGQYRTPMIYDGTVIAAAINELGYHTVLQDQMQGHWHLSASRQSYAAASQNFASVKIDASSSQLEYDAIQDAITDNINGTPRIGNETRNKQIRLPWRVCIASAYEPLSQVQWNEYINGLLSKVDRPLTVAQDDIDYVIESWTNGASWYRKYKSGWCEQGGYVSATTNPYSLNLFVPLRSYNQYDVTLTPVWATTGASKSIQYASTTTTGFSVYRQDAATNFRWSAKGFAL